MASTQFPNLPVATGLTGAEIVPIVQAGTSARTTVGAIALFADTGISNPPVGDLDYVLGFAADGALEKQSPLSLPISTATQTALDLKLTTAEFGALYAAFLASLAASTTGVSMVPGLNGAGGGVVKAIPGTVNLGDWGVNPDNARDTNTTRIQTALNHCRDSGYSWYLPPGDYETGPLIGYTSGRLDGRFLFDNNPTYDYGLLIAPLEEDVVDLDFAFVNSLAMVRGVDKLASLAPYYGYALSIMNFGDEVPIKRIGYPASTIRWSEAFIVHHPDGSFYPPIANTKTVATWSVGMIAKAIKIREPVIIDNFNALIQDIGAGSMEAVAVSRRPNVVWRGGFIRSESTNQVLQGYTYEQGGSMIRYEYCHVEGLSIVQTNYGWNGGGCDITLVGCSELYCRRGLDGHGAKHVQVIGGSFPNGVGGHWIHGLTVSGGTYLSSQYTNSAPVHASGGNVLIDGCKLVLRPGQYSLLNVRTDLSEMRGQFACINSDITLDCTTDLTTDRNLMSMDLAPAAEGHDWGRTIWMPDNVRFEGNTIWQRGASFTANIKIISFLGGNAGADNPDGIGGEGHMYVGKNSWKLDSPLLTAASNQKLMLAMTKNGGAWEHGAGYKVVMEDLPCLWSFLFCKNDVASISQPRCDFYTNRIGTLQWGANLGLFREACLGAVSYTNKLGVGRPSGGGTANTTAVGDENEIKTGDLYFFKGFNFGSLADGATASTTFSGCTGVTVGDSITAKFRGVAIGWFVEAACLTNGVITVMIMNKTGGTVDPPTTGLDIFVRRT